MNNLDWNDCPPEILYIIFQYLDTRTLVTCMLINKKLRNIAKYTADKYNLWEEIVRNEIVDGDSSFRTRSTLKLKDIYMNSLYWNYVNMTDIEHEKTYELGCRAPVKKMNVYMDFLILITESAVIYYDIKTFNVETILEISCINFEENDDIVAVHQHDSNLSTKLLLHPKPSSKHNLNLKICHTIKNITLYCMTTKLCYVYNSANVMWVIKYEEGRYIRTEPLGKLFNIDAFDRVTSLHVYDEDVFLTTKRAVVWHIHADSMGFRKFHSFDVPPNVLHCNWIGFDKISQIITVKKQEVDTERVIRKYKESSDSLMLMCVELTCATVHGRVLFLGFSDGRVEIHLPRKYKDTCFDGKAEPKRYFNIQEYKSEIKDLNIIALNVNEVKDSHILFVATKEQVFQLQLRYPEDLLA